MVASPLSGGESAITSSGGALGRLVVAGRRPVSRRGSSQRSVPSVGSLSRVDGARRRAWRARRSSCALACISRMWSSASCSIMAGCRISSSVSCADGWAAGHARWSIWTEVAYRDQEQPEVAHLGQQPVQGGLIGDRACDDGILAVAADLEALEPGGPPPVEDALDPDLVARVQPLCCSRPHASGPPAHGSRRAGRAGSEPECRHMYRPSV